MIHVWYSVAAEANHADADCFVCVFLSHGENDHVYAYDDKIAIQDITALFKGDKCKSLVGKPKIFILQVSSQMMRCLWIDPFTMETFDIQYCWLIDL